MQSTQQVFEGGAEAGFVVSILDDYGGIKTQAPVVAVRMALAFGYGPGAGNNHRILRNDEGEIAAVPQNCAIDQVEDRGSARENGAGGQNGAFAHDGPFVDT